MKEATFAARANMQLIEFDGCRMPGEPEFFRIGAGLFESEELTEALYRIYIGLCSDGWVSDQSGQKVDGIGHAYLKGFYLPCTERVVLSGQIDMTNDGLPDYAGLVTLAKSEVKFDSARRITRREAPRGTVAPPLAEMYELTYFYENRESDRAERRLGHKASLRFGTVHIAVTPSGAVVPCVRPEMWQDGKSVSAYGALCQLAAAAINATQDARFLWAVETGERLIGGAVETPMRLGVSAEHVKSLFYARQLPVTDSGRKRPILHWVRAHQRRLSAGIDIDVRKHMRGIDAFEMDGFQFRITNPRKGS